MDTRIIAAAALLAALAGPAAAADREGDALESRPASRAVPGPQDDRDEREQDFIEAERTRKTEERVDERGGEPARRQRLERRRGPTGTERDRKLEELRLRDEKRRQKATRKGGEPPPLERGVEEGRDEERGLRGDDVY